VTFNPAILAAFLVLRGLVRSLVLFLRCSVLEQARPAGVVAANAELVLIVPGLGRVSFLHRRSRLGLRMGPALREAILSF